MQVKYEKNPKTQDNFLTSKSVFVFCKLDILEIYFNIFDFILEWMKNVNKGVRKNECWLCQNILDSTSNISTSYATKMSTKLPLYWHKSAFVMDG